MIEISTNQLKRAVEAQHGGTATFVQAVPVHEEHGGQTVWDGAVHVFDLRGQPDGHFRAYAWAHKRADGKRHLLAVLHGGLVTGPQAAVRTTIVSGQRAGK